MRLIVLSFLSLLFGNHQVSERLIEKPIENNAFCYWQQHVNYTMSVRMDVKTFRYSGDQKLRYTNNSPDTLKSVYYHLYFNAFQPGSEMDVRSRTIPDPDSRVGDRIAALKENEIGYLKVSNLSQDGVAVKSKTEGTVLEVALAKPILPGQSTTFTLDFQGQVPVQIRRSGRNNAEGISLSMTQWYPKLAEYDKEGWHADPYIAREFYGVWGDFDVTITLDRNYTIAGTGYLQNPNQIGHGYENSAEQLKVSQAPELTWHFIAPNVHDFAWAADPDYLHDTLQVPGGPLLHFFYQNDPEIIENWRNLQPKTLAAMQFYNEHVGPYPYKQYSVIQGGDGGMEYGMCTLITGNRKFGSLVGVMAHEMAHSWFQFVLATNEAKHAWMDEGFTSYISDLCMNEIMNEQKKNPFDGTYKAYTHLATSGKEQPLGTHSDRYNYNMAYSLGAYVKGSVFLSQLGYIIGEEALAKTIKRYYQEFKFKHPEPNNIKRIAEKVSSLELDWYLTDWANTTNTIDYAIKEVQNSGGKSKVILERKSLMPMPIDLIVETKQGKKIYYYVPLRMMRGEKENPYKEIERRLAPDWAWAIPIYELEIDLPFDQLKQIQIDPSGMMADVELQNNLWVSP